MALLLCIGNDLVCHAFGQVADVHLIDQIFLELAIERGLAMVVGFLLIPIGSFIKLSTGRETALFQYREQLGASHTDRDRRGQGADGELCIGGNATGKLSDLELAHDLTNGPKSDEVEVFAIREVYVVCVLFEIHVIRSLCLIM
ncbi:hypothetical protein D3C73_1331860 [compost metagenome]